MTHVKHRPDLELDDALVAHEAFSKDIRKILKSSSLVLDVGANRGQFAQDLLGIMDVSRIYCFEPVPDAFRHLEMLASVDRRIYPVQAAISTERAEVPFFVTKSDVGSSMLRPSFGQPSQWLTLEREIKVNSIRLDDFIKEELSDKQPIDLLKSDAQGADKLVLESAGNQLSPDRIGSVLVEVNFFEFYEGQDRYTGVLDLLDSRGYRPARIYPHRAHDDWLWWADILFIGK